MRASVIWRAVSGEGGEGADEEEGRFPWLEWVWECVDVEADAEAETETGLE